MPASLPHRMLPSMSTLRVIIADDHPRYRLGLARLLTRSGMHVVGEAANGWAAMKAVEGTSPDVVVLDFNMPGPSAEEVIRRLTAGTPAHRVMVLSMSARQSDVRAALAAGASGYVLKDAPGDEIAAGVRAVAAGEPLFSLPVAATPVAGMPRRSMPERKVASRRGWVRALLEGLG
jgi:DNA-binding NarL/FixJ family response regulator